MTTVEKLTALEELVTRVQALDQARLTIVENAPAEDVEELAALLEKSEQRLLADIQSFAETEGPIDAEELHIALSASSKNDNAPDTNVVRLFGSPA